jgi:hypothetical protein
MIIPSEADFASPLDPAIEQYLATDTSTARDRVKLFRLVGAVLMPISVLISMAGRGYPNFPFRTPTVDLLHIKAPIAPNLEGRQFSFRSRRR